MKVKDSEKAGLKLNIQITKIMASSPMTNKRGNSGNSDRLFSWASKITSDGECSHEIKRWLLLGRKSMTKLDSMLKSRDITWPINVHIYSKLWFFQWSCIDVRVGP